MRFRRRHAELDERIATARDEARRSRWRLTRIREEVIRPLHAAAGENGFAQIIRESLLEGHGKP